MKNLSNGKFHSNIGDKLVEALSEADEVWIAVAMINSTGWNIINNIPESVRVHIIIGIDLPTPPSVLIKLKEKISNNFNAKVYTSRSTFHPKVYVIRKTNGTYIGYLGSSNATKGGLIKNVELNIELTDPVNCNDLVKWYWTIDDYSELITDKLIADYSTQYKKIKKREKDNLEDFNSIKEPKSRLSQFFTYNHHEVFAERYVEVENPEIKALRKEVRDRLIELHHRIYPQFTKYGLSGLYRHHSTKDIVSKHFFTPYSGYYIESLWLHYGKSKSQLKRYSEKESFLNHTRLQVIIHHKDIGIWLMLGIEKKGHYDRNHFRKQMESRVKRNAFFKALKKLSDEYWIDFKGWKDRVYVKDIRTIEDLHFLTKQEDISYYFILGRFYDPNDNNLSDLNIDNTILGEFQKLYPLYKIMSEDLINQ
ncbi:MAG: phospholipase D-like domain-containing protein [Ekhidna sp.]